MVVECPVCGESPCDGCKECLRCGQLTYRLQLKRWNDDFHGPGVCLDCWRELSHDCEGCPECLPDPDPPCYCGAPEGYCKC